MKGEKTFKVFNENFTCVYDHGIRQQDTLDKIIKVQYGSNGFDMLFAHNYIESFDQNGLLLKR